MSNYSDESEIIKVEKSESKKKTISLKNIEPVNGIKVIRDSSPDVSDSDSSLSSISVKKTKKVLRRKENSNINSNINPNIYQKPQEYDYSSFSNPKKVNTAESAMSDGSSYESDSDQSEIRDNGDNGDHRDHGNHGDHREKVKQDTWEDKQKMKQDLLIKIQALEKKGFEFSKKFTMTSNYEEMMFEFQKIKKFIETQAAIKFSRRCLMACVTGLEFLNKRFDPFHIKLEGWSENVMESVDDYDNIFEKLHEKYGGKAEIAPEIELLLTLGGSAFMFHLTNTLLKGPMMGNLVAQNNPNFMSSMMGAMSDGMKEMNKPPTGASMAGAYQNAQQNAQQNVQQRQNTFPKPMETRGQRQEMTGPSIDQNLFNGTPLASNHPSVATTFKQIPKVQQKSKLVYDNSPIEDDDRFSIASSDSSLSSISTSNAKNVVVKKVTNKKGKSGGFELNIS